MWPVGRADPPSKSNGAGANDTTKQPGSNDSSIVDLLDRVHDHLLADQYYDHSRLFLATDQATRQDLLFKSYDSEQSRDKQGLEGAIDDASPSHPETTAGTAEAASSPQSNTTNLHAAPPSPPPPPAEPEPIKTIKQFYDISIELLDAFLPANYPSPVAGKYYGAMRKIIEVSQRRLVCMKAVLIYGSRRYLLRIPTIL
jgi:hypothetical protein